jgi:hypothetical protein
VIAFGDRHYRVPIRSRAIGVPRIPGSRPDVTRRCPGADVRLTHRRWMRLQPRAAVPRAGSPPRDWRR